MNRAEHILTVVGEEGVEIAHRISKAKRFGLQEVQPGQELNNAQRVHEEMEDLIGAYTWAFQEGLLPPLNLSNAHVAHLATRKRIKVERFMEISRSQGTLQEVTGAAISERITYVSLEAIQEVFPEFGTNAGHGRVWTRPDGTLAKCFGVPGCEKCEEDQSRLQGAIYKVQGARK